MKWGADLHVIGLDKPERIEGVPWDGGVIDEVADLQDSNAWHAHIRPALSDRNGWAWLIGVPDMESPSQIAYDRLFNFARMNLVTAGGEWDTFNWPMADIQSAAEVESLRQSLPPELFRQECFGEIILASGRAFPDWDERIHVWSDAAKAATEYDPGLPICLSCDFNVSPLCFGVIQHDHQGVIRVIDEIAIDGTIGARGIDVFLDRAKEKGWNLNNLTLYGDSTGHGRKTCAEQAGFTDWIIVRNKLKDIPHGFRVPPSNPGLADTRNAVNAKLRSAAGNVTMYVSKRCRILIDNLQSALWPSPDDWRPLHALAWLRYFTNYEYPIRNIRSMPAGPIAVL